MCEKVLEEGGVYGQLKIMQCPVLMFPLDVDVISLERNFFFTHVFLVHKDPFVLCLCAYADILVMPGTRENGSAGCRLFAGSAARTGRMHPSCPHRRIRFQRHRHVYQVPHDR